MEEAFKTRLGPDWLPMTQLGTLNLWGSQPGGRWAGSTGQAEQPCLVPASTSGEAEKVPEVRICHEQDWDIHSSPDTAVLDQIYFYL